MGKKTMTALILVILMTVAIMRNQEEANFNMIIASVKLPKMVMMTAMSAGGFLVGILVAASRKSNSNGTYHADEQGEPENFKRGTLSDEDRDYISGP